MLPYLTEKQKDFLYRIYVKNLKKEEIDELIQLIDRFIQENTSGMEFYDTLEPWFRPFRD